MSPERNRVLPKEGLVVGFIKPHIREQLGYEPDGYYVMLTPVSINQSRLLAPEYQLEILDQVTDNVVQVLQDNLNPEIPLGFYLTVYKYVPVTYSLVIKVVDDPDLIADVVDRLFGPPQ